MLRLLRPMTQAECDDAGIVCSASNVNVASYTAMMFVLIVVFGIIAGAFSTPKPIAEAAAKVALEK